jgi:two-component system, sensor histidine kinase YesM
MVDSGDRAGREPRGLSPFLTSFMTLKKRIVIIFIVIALVPYASITVLSYLTISSILSNKIQSGIQDSLKQAQLFLENSISNLNHISQQLTLEGSVGAMLERYLTNLNPFERSMLKRDIRNELNVIAFTNPNVGLIMYYFKDGSGSRDLETSPVKEHFTPSGLPLLAAYYGISYFGPHISNDRFSGQYVISALRKIDFPDRDDVYVYLESGFKLTRNILNSDRVGINSFHLLLDNDGRISYSEVPTAFPVDSPFAPGTSAASGLAKNFYWFKATSNQGWSLVSLVTQAEYNKEKDRWIDQIVLLSLVFLVFSIFLAGVLWEMVYKPLNLFSREMTWIDQNDFHLASIPTRIPEFDFLLGQFQDMKKRIIELLAEAEQKEKRRADLEIENLLYQINPHFLMNSLNTVHWLAIEKGQTEIDRLVQAINRLLFYNLGKSGKSATLREETAALREYIVLQQSRYDFEFEIAIRPDDRVLDTPIPRFILQPLVENAIFHGLSEAGRIWIEICLNGRLEVSVHDNGPGMTEATIRNLLDERSAESGRFGMGIGLKYVKRALDSYYGGLSKLEIESVEGKGTTIHLSLPVGKEEPRDQDTGSRG